jgi:hypothetical protein
MTVALSLIPISKLAACTRRNLQCRLQKFLPLIAYPSSVRHHSCQNRGVPVRQTIVLRASYLNRIKIKLLAKFAKEKHKDREHGEQRKDSLFEQLSRQFAEEGT